jgi:predicted GH43/DUF377 family glycosyl hydrolase
MQDENNSGMPRFEGNPILKPIPEHSWESKLVFNPAMFELGDRVHFIYRAMGDDMVSRLGYASSNDGQYIDERIDHPVFEPENPSEVRGVEDPRVTVYGDRCYMTYTAYGQTAQIGITSIKSKDVLEKNWYWSERTFPFPGVTNKDSALFPVKVRGKFVLFHRIEPNLCIAFSDDMRNWNDSRIVMTPRENSWDSIKVGIAGPPIEIEEGWLQIYHGVDQNKVYRLGALLLEKDNPEKILYRSEAPLFEPQMDYERNGFVPNVVFSCGAIRRGNEVLISYGAADTVVSVSKFSLDEILLSARSV